MKTKNIALIGTMLLCVAFAVGYVLLAANRNTKTNLPAPSQAVKSKTLGSAPQLITINKDNAGNIGHIQTKPLANENAKPDLVSDFRCERVYYAGDTGICLWRYFPNPMVATVSVTLFSPNLQPKFQLATEGIPSRARVSRDGKLAAYTTFISGHNYTDPRLSTKTMLIDIVNQKEIANLESFAVFKDGQRIQAADFNFWGVTFADDGNTFYATLRTNGENDLVRGDIAQQRMEIIHVGVECPSLSPDGTRIAFKRLNADKATWRIFTLDLATKKEQPLSETGNVDDQVEWLDNERVLYERYEVSAIPRLDVMLMNANGSGTPQVFLADAGSPAVVR